MSRINYGESDDVASMLRGYAWEANVGRALKGKRGQTALRKLEAALLAMPRSLDGRGRLIEGSLLRPVPQLEDQYEVCALGALCLAEGLDAWELYVTWEKGDARSQDWRLSFEYKDKDYDADELMELGPSLGMSKTMAWAIMEENDEALGSLTPEQRWEGMLKWVRGEVDGGEKMSGENCEVSNG